MTTDNVTYDTQVWTTADSAAASKEGWDVFHVNGYQFEIQKLDLPEDEGQPQFTEDPLAVFHVYDRALRGSILHRKALFVVLHPSNIR